MARRRSLPVLDLGGVHPVFTTHQNRFFDAELPAQLRLRAFERFDAKRYDAETLEWGRVAWQLRTLDEYRSFTAFTGFLDTLNGLGCAFDILSTAVRTVRDEARHVELCRRLVRALGGDDRIPGTPDWVLPEADQPQLVQALATVIGSLCIGETLSVALLAATRDVAEDPLARALLKTLTADESVHSQLGWALLPLLWPMATKGRRRHLTAGLRTSLKLAREAVFAGGSAEGGERNPFGELFLGERTEVYEQSLERDVLRRFRELGIRV